MPLRANLEIIPLTKLKVFDFSQIEFDADPIQVLSLSHGGERMDLPLRRPPVDLSVLRSDGLFSNRWGANVNKKGDAYIYCRDNPDREKISLHVSGRQHISLSNRVRGGQAPQERVGPVWEEPDIAAGAIATFSLIFPPWGLGIERKARNRHKDELLIIGHPEKFIVVRFFVANPGKNLKGSMPHMLIGKLPLREGKELQVIACKEPDNGLMDRIKASAFPEISSTFHQRNMQHDDYILNLAGFDAPNSAFMLSVPVKYTPRDRNR